MSFKLYARYYDIFYKRKDYRREIAFLEQVFKKYGSAKPKTVLDLGCGTANHMIPLLQRGYRVAGIDASKDMLSVARKKLDHLKLRGELKPGTLQKFSFGKTFDAVICMFSVIDYLLTDQALLSTFRNVSRHMKRGSLFVLDFWQASAVESYYTPEKSRSFRDGRVTVSRRSKTVLDQKKKRCDVFYTCVIDEQGKARQSFQETHRVRYFEIDEMMGFLIRSGLTPVGVFPFMNTRGKIMRNTWDVTVVAKKLS